MRLNVKYQANLSADDPNMLDQQISQSVTKSMYKQNEDAAKLQSHDRAVPRSKKVVETTVKKY